MEHYYRNFVWEDVPVYLAGNNLQPPAFKINLSIAKTGPVKNPFVNAARTASSFNPDTADAGI